MNIREQIEKDAGVRGHLIQKFSDEVHVNYPEISKTKLRNKLLKAGWRYCPNKKFINKGNFYLHDNKFLTHYYVTFKEAK